MTEAQLQDLNDSVMQLGQMLQESRQREVQLEQRLQGVEMAGQTIGPALQALATSQTELANAVRRDEKKSVTLIDNRGVGKPEKFVGKENESFLRWKIKLESFIYSIFPELEKVLAWAEDQDSTVTLDRARAAFGIGTAEPVEDLPWATRPLLFFGPKWKPRLSSIYHEKPRFLMNMHKNPCFHL